MKKLKIALLCGGPSLERGISLNSARSACDHLQSEDIEILPLYFDHLKNPYAISRAQLYSNTPSDFDFKLHHTAKPLGPSGFRRFLKNADLAFPAMHGAFGEDGQIQRILEGLQCPFVGSSSAVCKRAFDKHTAGEWIKKHEFYTLPSVLLKSHLKNHEKLLTAFFRGHQIKRAIVKPANGGSSIGVYSVSTVKEALSKAHELFSKRAAARVIVEPFCEGKEFTVIILENRFDLPTAILPVEMELDYSDHQIFDYRKKYLASRQVTYHCPPRFDDAAVERIQIQAEQLFKLLGMRDFARFDGWILPDGKIWFSDFNPVSGMEQNSFLFLQAAQIGMSHGDALRFIVKNACRRYGIPFPVGTQNFASLQGTPAVGSPKKQINVLFGGNTAERQVSVMSGTNVWLKLRNSQRFEPHPYLLDTKNRVWRLPYHLTLNHTVEEIQENCEKARESEQRLHRLKTRVIDKLSPLPGELSQPFFLPEKMTLPEFIRKSDFVFIGLHGGIGENGTLQRTLEKARVPFNGSGSAASALCMDKFATGEVIHKLCKKGIDTAPKKLIDLSLFHLFKPIDYKRYWRGLTRELSGKSLIVKPHDDGCSAGIARLYSAKDLEGYIHCAVNKAQTIPPGILTNQHGLIEMPASPMKKVMFEPFIITDRVRVIGNKLDWQTRTNWIEVTVGVLEKDGKLKAMNPSITVAIGNILTLEEKFQGGTGVNITPPPAPYVKPSAVKKAKTRMELAAKALGIRGYARIDAFMHVKTGELLIIEANTTPGLTPSTVIYHQALAENPPMYPGEFLERIIGNSSLKSTFI